MKRIILTVFLTMGLVFAMAMPASATIHEIVASWCAATHDVPTATGTIHNPPGLSGVSNADNIAQPLLASGVVTPEQRADGTYFTVNSDHPAVKFEGTGEFTEIAPGVFLEVIEPDHTAFDHCENFQFHS